MLAKRLLVVVTVCVVSLARQAAADVPYPANPRPCTGLETDPPCIDATAFAEYLFLPTTEPLTLPNDFGNDNWKFTSEKTGNAEIDGSAQELFGVKGASVDRAWQVTTGRPDVRIAVLDSGIRWQDQLGDLVDKFYLNRGELPVPEGSTNTRDAYDRNNDGLFTLKDYRADDTHAADSRVSDQNGNGMIDPEDLIFLFSDGTDADDNGYIDDISGWDFFEDDNDALDEVRYGHGTGESHDSAAEANNGGGDPGSCPNCLLIEVRVGDSFVTDVNLFAQGVVFAVDSGASVVQEALGTLNQTRFGQEAVDYAYRNGVVVIASAADEESNHHNYPANYNHTVQVNSVTRFQNFGPLTQSPESYLYLNGCTNFGAHIALAVPSSSCSSEATGRSAGMAGLVISAALNAIDRGTLTRYPRDGGGLGPFALSAEEVKQILTMTADDINFDARDDVDPPLPQNYVTTIAVPGVQEMQRFPSIAGFDQYFGYGRINANNAVRRVAEGNIPPEATIELPAWFATIDPEKGPTLTVYGRVAANRADSFSYTIEVAPGVQPAEADFQEVVSVDNRTAAIDGQLGVIDIDELSARMPHGVDGPAVTEAGLPDPDRFTFTIRVRVIDNQGRRGEDRRALALHHDPDLVDGFPVQMGADGVSAPVTADISGDGIEDIILANSNGEVNAIGFSGGGFNVLQGWPVRTDPLEIHADAPGYTSGGITTPVASAVLGAVAVGDLDHDGHLEVVATDLQGKAYAWDRNGVRLPGFPVSTLPEYSNTRRSERDLGTPEGRVPDRVNRHTSQNRVGRALAGGPILANLDASPDQSLEIIAGSFDRHIYAWHRDGQPVAGWPLLLKDPAKVASINPLTNEVTLKPDAGDDIGTKILVPPSVGDLDGDGSLEVIAVVNEEYREPLNWRVTNPLITIFRAAGAIDPGNTRVYAVYAAGTGSGDQGDLVPGWNPQAFLPGWPVKTALITTGLLPTVGTGSNGPPALADVDADGIPEIATFSAVGPLYLFTAEGVSFFGKQATGQDITFESEVLGPMSNSIDTPSFGSLGGPVLAEFAGPGKGFHLIAPASGLGKFLDAQLTEKQSPADNHLGVWEITNADGSPTTGGFSPAFPRVVNDLQFVSAPAVADITGDGKPEVLAGSGVYDLHAFDITGAEPADWPKFTNGWMIGSPAVGDVDGDGLLEVVGTTREGNLFVWNATGDECGFIPWRHWHHDERGTGNYDTDARPPASLQASDIESVTAIGPGAATIALRRVPGDDLFCDTASDFDIRFADSEITTEEAFQAALFPSTIAHPAGSRGPGNVTISDGRLVDRTVYLALAVGDEQGNRTSVLSLGSVTFPAVVETTPTPTRTAFDPPNTSTPTVNDPVSTATTTAISSPTPTEGPAQPTATRTIGETATPTPVATTPAAPTNTRAASPTVRTAVPTATARPALDDDGCSMTPGSSSRGAWWLLPAFVLVALKRRRR